MHQPQLSLPLNACNSAWKISNKAWSTGEYIMYLLQIQESMLVYLVIIRKVHRSTQQYHTHLIVHPAEMQMAYVIFMINKVFYITLVLQCKLLLHDYLCVCAWGLTGRQETMVHNYITSMQLLCWVKAEPFILNFWKLQWNLSDVIYIICRRDSVLYL